MANSVLTNKARAYVYRDGDKFSMKKDFLEAEVMLHRHMMNEVYAMPEHPWFELYPEADAREIIDELWSEMIETGRALE